MFFDIAVIILLVILNYGIWCAIGALDEIKNILEDGFYHSTHSEGGIQQTDFDPLD